MAKATARASSCKGKRTKGVRKTKIKGTKREGFTTGDAGEDKGIRD